MQGIDRAARRKAAWRLEKTENSAYSILETGARLIITKAKSQA